MPSANPIFAAAGTTIFETMSRLAEAHGAINLGQGFPDGNGPPDVVEEARRWLAEGWNQYPPMPGLPILRQAVAAHVRRFHGLELDWQREVLVTSGATEALAACLLGLLRPGDEVVLFAPLYDSYIPIVRQAGAVPRMVNLHPPGWTLDPAELAAACGPRTKMFLLNTPQNPCAKVWSRAELELLAAAVQAHDAVAVCDEVYEHLVFDGARHIPLMTLPGMRERCLRIGSAGKTFSLTGWKVGYVAGDAALLQPVAKAHQYLTFTTPPNLQAAVALGLGKDDGYFHGLAAEMQAKRDRLAAGLARAGLPTLAAAGTYFILVDLAAAGIDEPDDSFCRRLTQEAKVAAIPVSAFFERDPPRHLIRFCFCKRDTVLDEAVARLAAYRAGSRTPG